MNCLHYTQNNKHAKPNTWRVVQTTGYADRLMPPKDDKETTTSMHFHSRLRL